MISESVGSGRFRVLGLNCGFSALASRRMRGSWVVSIHPRAQSILGWFAANHGYPRITPWGPRSVRKKRMLVRLVPVCTCKSTKYLREPVLFVVPSTLSRGRSWGRRLNDSFSHLAYVRLMKFSVAPESRRAGASVLLCAAWMYVFRFMDFRLDMYTLSEAFLSWAAWVRRTSASSFFELSASYEESSNSGVLSLFSGELNVTDFIRRVDGSAVGLGLPLSDSSRSYRVLLPVESSS